MTPQPPPEKLRLLAVMRHTGTGGDHLFNLALFRHWLRHCPVELSLLFLSDARPDLETEFRSLGAPIHYASRHGSREEFPEYFNALLARGKIDRVLLTNCSLVNRLMPFFRAKNPAAGFVDIAHNEMFRSKQGGHAGHTADAAPWLDRIIVISGHLRDWMRDKGVPEEKLALCRIHVDAEHWSPEPATSELREKWRLDPDKPLILIPARLDPVKRPIFGLEILRALLKKGRPLQAFFAGHGSETENLLLALRQPSVRGAVHWIGNRTPGEMRELLRLADIVLLPSQHEGISLALYEAMSMALPVVAADVGGQRELIAPGTGFLIPPAEEGEEAAYVSILDKLLAHAGLRKSTGQAAREHILRHFTFPSAAENAWRLVSELPPPGRLPAMSGEELQARVRGVLARAHPDEHLGEPPPLITHRDLLEKIRKARAGQEA